MGITTGAEHHTRNRPALPLPATPHHHPTPPTYPSHPSRQVLEGLGPLAAEHVRRFEDAEITPDLLVDLSWEQLTSIGVPLGHAIKLHRAFAATGEAKKPDSEG